MSSGQEYDPSRHSPYRTHPPQHGAPQPGYGAPQPGYGGVVPIGYGGGYGTHPQWQPAVTVQSGVGVASFVMAVIGGVALLALVATAGVMESRTPGGMDENSPAAIAVGLGILAGLVLNAVGIVLGIVAVFQRDRKKVFAVLGLTFNALTLLAVVGLMVIGLTMS
jgi:hypothetical protein